MIALLRGGISETGGVWADLGAGSGNFTWALGAILGPQATIHAIDRDARAVQAIERRLQTERPSAIIQPRQADVTRPLSLPPLDGILLANVLHFIRQQEQFLAQIAAYIKPGGRLLVVEYEQARPIPWVPFPVAFNRLAPLAQRAGFASPTQIATRRSPSSGQTMYAAVALVRK